MKTSERQTTISRNYKTADVAIKTFLVKLVLICMQIGV